MSYLDENVTDEGQRRHVKLQTKLGFIFSVLTMAIATLSLAALYFSTRHQVRQNTRQRLHDIVAIAAQRVDADLHTTLTEPEQEGNTAYLQLKGDLQHIRDIGSDLYYVYTMRLDTDGQIRFVVDAEEDSAEIAHLDEVYDDASELLRSNIETLDSPIVEETFYTDEWGTWLTGYAPIYGADGQRVGVLGIDIKANQVRAYEQQLLVRMLLVLGITSPLALFLGWVVGRRIATPVVRLTTAATAIASGDLEQPIPTTERNDEVGLLAWALGKMADQLRRLIRDLERRVEKRTSDLAQHSRYLEASAEVGRAAASILDADELMQTVVKLIRDQFDLYYVGLFLVEEAKEWAVLKAGTGEAGIDMVSRGHRIRIGDGMIGWCIAKASARIADVAEEDTVRLATQELPETRSEAALPLHSRGRVIGALTVQSDRLNAFDEDSITVLQTMADQVAVALDNAQLYQKSQAALEAERRAYGEAVRQAWQQLSKARRLQGYRCDADGLAPSQGNWLPEMEKAIASGEIVLADDVQPGDKESKQTAAIPIRVRDQVVGVLRFRKGEGRWTGEEITLLETLTERLSAALESARLYEGTQRRAARERLTGEITGRMRETLEVDTVLQTAIREIGEALDIGKIKLRMSEGDGR